MNCKKSLLKNTGIYAFCSFYFVKASSRYPTKAAFSSMNERAVAQNVVFPKHRCQFKKLCVNL